MKAVDGMKKKEAAGNDIKIFITLLPTAVVA